MNNSLNERILDRNNKSNFIKKPPFPQKNLLIELSNACNNQCIFCANRKMTRKRGSIKFDILNKILKDCYNLGTREVGFYTTGEPLLYRKLEESIKLAKEIGYSYVYITTNGILCTLEKFKKLLESGLDSIKISINALDEKSYKLIHNTDSFNLVMKNLQDMYNYKLEHKLDVKIFVSYIATKYTNHTTNQIKKFFSNMCDEVMVVNVRNQSGLTPENITLLGGLNDLDKIKAERELPCHYVFNTINVTYEGYLTACCTDFQNYLVYGNANINSIKKCWHNRIITSLRKQHLNKKLKNNLCRNCIFNSLNVPKPLIKKYATKFNETIFVKTDAEKRIHDFCEDK